MSANGPSIGLLEAGEVKVGTETKTTEHHEATIKKTGTGATASPDDHKLPENSHENLDEKLDNAMDETFPGSDPVSIKITK